MEPQNDNEQNQGWPTLRPGATEAERREAYRKALGSPSGGFPEGWWDRLPAADREAILQHAREVTASERH